VRHITDPFFETIAIDYLAIPPLAEIQSIFFAAPPRHHRMGLECVQANLDDSV
jgi:hypothetical protein